MRLALKITALKSWAFQERWTWRSVESRYIRDVVGIDREITNEVILLNFKGISSKCRIWKISGEMFIKTHKYLRYTRVLCDTAGIKLRSIRDSFTFSNFVLRLRNKIVNVLTWERVSWKNGRPSAAVSRRHRCPGMSVPDRCSILCHLFCNVNISLTTRNTEIDFNPIYS